MLETSFADEFAKEWISSWNSYDLEKVSTDDFLVSSPLIMAFLGDMSGTVKGKEGFEKYWTKIIYWSELS